MRVLTMILAIAFATTAQAQNNTLAQLGAKGVTTTGGSSAYRDYLVRLDASGKFSLACMPQGLVAVPFAQLVYIDRAAGTNTSAATGGVTLPYRSLDYAVGAFVRRQLEPVVYLLNPGIYDSVSLDALVTPGVTDFAVCGYGSDSTVVPELEFESAGGGDDVTVTLSGVRVQLLAQRNAKTLTLRLRAGARVDTLRMDYPSTCTIVRDPDASVGVFQGSGGYTETLSASASGISFGGNTYTNVANALNYLIERDRVLVHVSALDTNVWSTTARSWTNSAAYGITGADVAQWRLTYISASNDIFWTATSVEWTNSAARHITAGDTNSWTAAATRDPRIIVLDATHFVAFEAPRSLTLYEITITEIPYLTITADPDAPACVIDYTDGENVYHPTNYFPSSITEFPFDSDGWIGETNIVEGTANMEYVVSYGDIVWGSSVGGGDAMALPARLYCYTPNTGTGSLIVATATYTQILTNAIPLSVGGIASPLKFGPVIATRQSEFTTDGTNLWWRNVNDVFTCLTRSDAVYSSTGITNLWSGDSAAHGAATAEGADPKTVYLIEE